LQNSARRPWPNWTTGLFALHRAAPAPERRPVHRHTRFSQGTPEGILLIYNGADDRLVYRTGWVLFDRQDPTRVLARADTPVFEPQREWGPGAGADVVFVEGLVREGNRWLFYYGGADKHIGAAEAFTTGPARASP
jgi:predicted GH43/DUF377 family glycosyl hydrolase